MQVDQIYQNRSHVCMISPIKSYVNPRHLTTISKHFRSMASDSPFYNLKAELPGRKVYDFAQLEGKVVLIVNTASEWQVDPSDVSYRMFNRLDYPVVTRLSTKVASISANIQITNVIFFRSPSFVR